MSFDRQKLRRLGQTLAEGGKALRARLAAWARTCGLVDRLRRAASGRAGMAGLMAAHALVVYFLAGFFLLGPLAKAVLERQIGSALGRQVLVERAWINPLTFSFGLTGLKILEPDGQALFAGLDRFEAQFAPLQLVRSRVAVNRLLVENPFVRLARDESGRLNIADLLPEPESAQPQPGPAGQEAEGADADLSGPQDLQAGPPEGDAQASGDTQKPASQPGASATAGQASGPSAPKASGDAEKGQAAEVAPASPQANAAEAAPALPQTSAAEAAPALPPASAAEAGGAAATILSPPGMAFRLQDVLLTGGSVLFEDAQTGARHELRDLRFGVTSLASDEPGLRELFSSGGVLNNSSVQLTVKADPFGPAPEAQVRLQVREVDLKPYAPYLKGAQNLDFHLERAGILAGVRFPHLNQGDRSPVLDLDVRLDGVTLAVEGRQAASLESGAVHGAVLDLAGGGLDVEQVELASPALSLERDESGHTTLDALVKALETGEKPAEQASVFPVRLARVEVKNGRASYADKGLGLELGLDGLRLEMTGFDLGRGTLGQVSARAQGSHFESLALTASGAFAHLDLTAGLTLSGVDLSRPGPVLRRFLPNLALAGRAEVEAKVRLEEHNGAPTGRLTADLHASDLRLAGLWAADKPLVSAGGVRLAGLEADLSGKALGVGQAEVSDAVVRLARDRQGGFLLERLFSSSKAEPSERKGQPAPAEPDGQPGQADQAGASGDQPSGQAKAAAGQAKAPQGGSQGVGVHLKEFSAARLTVEYQPDPDAAMTPVAFERLVLRGAAFPPTQPLEIEAKGQAFATGGFTLAGKADPAGPGGQLRLGVSGLPLAQVARLVPGLPLSVAGGLLDMEGELTGTLAGKTPAARYAGDLTLSGLSLAASGQAEPVAGLERFEAKGLDLAWPPLLKARSLTLSGPAVRLVLDQDGQPGLAGLAPAPPEAGTSRSAREPGKGAARTREPAQADQTRDKSVAGGKVQAAQGQAGLPAFDLGEVVVRKGRADVDVLGLEQPVRLFVSGIELKAWPVRTDQPGQLTLAATVGHSGRLSAEGQAGWVAGAPMLDLKARLENLELSELSPLSQKYTGFPIARGKLALNLDYKAGRRLYDLKNRVVVLGIQLGRKTPLPGGKDVPLDLAVSLLSDSKGAISLDIPVSGGADNLKADLSGVIANAVAGAFAKVLFSPLAFLNVAKSSGSTVAVAFEPGTADLTAEGAKTLADLAQALADRPRLNLELAAYVDTVAEDKAFAARLAEQKAREQAASVQPVEPKKTLRERLTRTKTPTPPAQDAQPAAPPEPPTPAQWRALAEARLEAARRYLVETAKLPEARVFSLAADPLKPPGLTGAPGGRVDATLKY